MKRITQALAGALLALALCLAAPAAASAAIVQTGPCAYAAVPAEANSVTSIDGYVFSNATYLNAANHWYDVIYRPAWLAGTYKPCQVVYAVSVQAPVSGTVGDP